MSSAIRRCFRTVSASKYLSAVVIGKILDEAPRLRNKVYSSILEMRSRSSDNQRTVLVTVALCLSCILAVSCKTAPKVVEPQGQALGRAQEEPTPPEHDVDHPPPDKGGGPGERMQKKADSTPTPTPTRDIDRPLDPIGRPLTPPTP